MTVVTKRDGLDCYHMVDGITLPIPIHCVSMATKTEISVHVPTYVKMNSIQ